jgi:hypothetical protein
VELDVFFDVSDLKRALRSEKSVVLVLDRGDDDGSQTNVLACRRVGKELIAKHYPEFAYKAFYCGSWLLDPQLANMLKPESNIVNFGKKFIKIARKDPTGSDPLSFVFLQRDPNNVDFESLPENTSLERSLKKHYIDGKRIYVSHGLIFK